MHHDEAAARPGSTHYGCEIGALSEPMTRRQHAPEPQAESSVRPLRRRAARMARPARVRMRRRKPWVLARRRLFGWKVRLLTFISVTARTSGPRVAGGAGRGVGRNRRPALTSRACENGRQGLVYGTRALTTGSNQTIRTARMPASSSADPRHVSDTPGLVTFSVLDRDDFRRFGCRAPPGVVSVRSAPRLA